MMIETPDGAVLELFWRRRGDKPWSETTALHFLSRYRGRTDGLRSLLAERSDAGSSWRSSHTALLSRVASLIATGRVIVADFDGAERWPGTGFLLQAYPQPSILFWSDRLHLHRDVHRAQELLGEMQKLLARAANTKEKLTGNEDELLQIYRRHLTSLRGLISANPAISQYVNLSDHQFLQTVFQCLEDDQLLPIYHRYPGVAEPGPSAAVAPQPNAHATPGGRDQSEDPSENPDVPGVCLLCAANQGAAFVTMPR